MKDLFRAYTLAKQLTRLDAISAVAGDFGQFLASVNAKDKARPLLAEARDGWLKLGQTEAVMQIDARRLLRP